LAAGRFREIRSGLPAVLRKGGRVVLPVLVVVDASASEAELGRGPHEISTRVAGYRRSPKGRNDTQ